MGKFFREPQYPDTVKIPAESITIYCSRLSDQLINYMNYKGYILVSHFAAEQEGKDPTLQFGHYTVHTKRLDDELDHTQFMKIFSNAEEPNTDLRVPQTFTMRVVNLVKDTGKRIIKSINFSAGQESQVEEQIAGEVVEA